MSQDGIEIHFDEKRGYLELACEPDAFSAYREIARDQLKGCPEISIDRVKEIHIVDTATFVERRDTQSPCRGLVVGALVVVVLILAVIGAISVIAKFVA